MMRVRQILGDVGFVVLLVLPAAALSRPEPGNSDDQAMHATPLLEETAFAERSPLERRFSLPG